MLHTLTNAFTHYMTGPLFPPAVTLCTSIPSNPQ